MLRRLSTARFGSRGSHSPGRLPLGAGFGARSGGPHDATASRAAAAGDGVTPPPARFSRLYGLLLPGALLVGGSWALPASALGEPGGDARATSAAKAPAAAPQPGTAPAPAGPAPSPPGPAAPSPTPAPVDPEAALLTLARDLELSVTEVGPDQPWTLQLHNRGAAPIGVMADAGLLWFEVAVPGKATQTCRLPEPLWPRAMRRRAELVLPAGERFQRRFDPRFFCYADLVQTALVPGAKITPHFGWPHETRSVVVNKRRVQQPAPPRAPFVAWLPPAPPPEAAAQQREDAEEAPTPPPAELDGHSTRGASSDDGELAEASWQPPTEGVKNVTGTAFVLSPEYGKWSAPAPPAPDGLVLAMLAGSDAEDKRGAVVTLGIGNNSDEPQAAVVRRELLSFDVVGPDGELECPVGEMGPPDSASFSTLAPGASQRFVVRLIEKCPSGSFSRPGLYEIHATWHSKFSGQGLGIDAFVGSVSSERPALVRVRSGERASFLRAAPMVARGAPPAGGEVPPEGAQEAPLPPGPDEAPADHEGLPAPEDGLAPDAPGLDGLQVE